ncbi:uncharacterized protein LOC116159992 [Photinus pyralis]|nr:uncharacterized protein LOC116159992 [Photinus pyralis]
MESTQNTQFMTQSFYDGATQAVEGNISTSNAVPEMENPQNYFDDDYNFADVSTQLPPPSDLPGPSKALSIHDMPTQLFCEDVQESVVVASDAHPKEGLCEDIHEIETQIVENTSIHNLPTQLTKAVKGSSIHNMPTQVTRNENIPETKMQPPDSTSVHNMPTQPTKDTKSQDIIESRTQSLDGTSINNMPTQLTRKAQENVESRTQSLDGPSINNMPTQLTRKAQESVESRTQSLEGTSIHNMPTQLTKDSRNNDSFNSTSVIDDTINESDIREESSDSQSHLQVNQLRRRAIRSIRDDSETNSKESQSEEVVRFKLRKRKTKIIESDSETDAEEEMIKKTVANLSNSETDTENDIKGKLASDSDTDAEDLVREPTTVNTGIGKVQESAECKPSMPDKGVPSIDSDSDLDDFEFNTQAVTSNVNEDEDDFIIPSTQLEEPTPVAVEERSEDVNKMANSVEMDSLYLEPTQPMVNDEALLAPPAGDKPKIGTSSNIAVDDDEIFIKPTQVLESTGAKDRGDICKQTTDNNSADDDIFIKPTQVLEQVVANDQDDIFEQATQPVAFHQQNSEDIFLQSTQPIREIEDPIFLKPAIPSPKKNLAVSSSQSDDIFMQPTQPIVDNKIVDAPSDDIFLQPTQLIDVKVADSEDEVFGQPTQLIEAKLPHLNDDVFDQPTQVVTLNSKALAGSHIEKQLEDMFASQRSPEKLPQVESQLEVVFDSQNIVVGADNSRPSNPLLTELEDKSNDTLDTRRPLRRVAQRSNNKALPEVKDKDSIEQDERSRTRAHSKKSPSTDASKTKAKLLVEMQKLETDEAQSKTHPKRKAERPEQDSPQTSNKDVDMSTLSKIDKRKLAHKEREIERPRASATTQGPKRSTRGKGTEKLDTKEESKPQEVSSADSGNEQSFTTVTEGPKRSTRSKGNAKEDLQPSKPHVTSPSSLKVEQPQSPENSSVEEQSKVKRSTTEDVKRSTQVNKRKLKDLELTEPQNKRASADSGIEEQSKVSSVAKTEGPKRSTRGKGNAKVDIKEESQPSKPLVTSTPNKKSTRKKDQAEKYVPLSENIQPEIIATTRSARGTTKTNDVPATEVEATKRPKRNASVPRKFMDTEANNADSKRSNRMSKQALPESESEGSTKIFKVTKRQKEESSELTTSTSVSEQQTRKVGRGKRVLNAASENAVAKKKHKTSDSDSDEFIPKTPVRGRVLLNSTVSESTPDRNKRALKPKVVFTMLDSPDLESVIRRLGGRVVDSVEACTVLVTGSLKRSQKLLTAVGQCKPICSPDWIRECKKVNKFLDPWDYILQDEEAEDKWQLSLKESLKRSRDHKLLEDYVVYLTVTNAIDVLKGAVESCGGKCLLKAPTKSTENLIVVANAENKSKYTKFLKQTPPATVVLPEAIFDGVLRQELHLEEHLLK